MAKTYGVPYPERRLMAELSDHLGFEHFPTSNGGSVTTPFLAALATRLGINPGQYVRRKDELLLQIVRVATLDPDPDRKKILSPGGTVKNTTLQIILDGVRKNHQLGPVPQPPKQPDGPVAYEPPASLTAPPAPPADPFPTSTGGADLPTGQDALDMPVKQLEDLLDPDGQLDPEDRRLLATAYREGQDKFRAAVLDAYRLGDYPACAVTGHGPAQVLEAAHLVPHGIGGVMTVDNGICLRRDIHALMDRRLLAIHEETLTVLIHPVLEAEPEYAALAGRKIRVPKAVADRPAPAALKHRRLAAGL